MFQIRTYRNNLVIMTIVWSFGSFAFFMVPFYLENVKANFFYLSLSTEFAELLASIICYFIQRCISLKKALIIFSLMIAAGSFGMLFIASEMADETAEIPQNKQFFNVGLILVTNLGIVAAFDVAYLINGELFPTILLATAYGCCNILGRLITIAAPGAALLPQPWPLIILLAFAMLCAFLSLFLVKIK